MDDQDWVAVEVGERLMAVTEDLWTRRQTERAVAEEAGGSVGLNDVTLTDQEIAEQADATLSDVRAWLDAEEGRDIAVQRRGEARLITALLGG